MTRHLLLLSCAAGALSFASCKNDLHEVAQVANYGGTPVDKAEGVTVFYSTAGRLKAKLEAAEFIRSERAKPPYSEAQRGLEVQFYDDSLGVSNTLTAEYGRWYETRGSILLRRDVVVVNAKGEKLQTEELVWNSAVGKFYTDKPVRIQTPTQLLTGDGLEANEDFTYYQITNLKGTVQIDRGAVPE